MNDDHKPDNKVDHDAFHAEHKEQLIAYEEFQANNPGRYGFINIPAMVNEMGSILDLVVRFFRGDMRGFDLALDSRYGEYLNRGIEKPEDLTDRLDVAVSSDDPDFKPLDVHRPDFLTYVPAPDDYDKSKAVAHRDTDEPTKLDLASDKLRTDLAAASAHPEVTLKPDFTLAAAPVEGAPSHELGTKVDFGFRAA